MIRPILTLTLIAALAGCGSERPSQNLASMARGPAATAVPVSGTISSKSAKELFGNEHSPSLQRSEPFGSYAKGCAAGNVQLPETGPTWQAMRLSRNRNWGQPATIGFLEDLSRKAAQMPGWSGLYIGDISQPKGGPMPSGHASHQIGLDADIWMLPPQSTSLSRTERENISSISMQRASGASVNSGWSPQHHALLKAAASDPRVARIFVFPGAKVQMCKDET
ncbi:MAG: penicillin-insensitive murein endopeptidase, partial [Rhodobacterales bacterium]